MEIRHTKYKKNYRVYILNCLDLPDNMANQELKFIAINRESIED